VIVLVDGAREERIPAVDSTVIRGDGVFEAIRSYAGQSFALDEHLGRLARSAAAVGIQLPDDDRIGGWVRMLASEGRDGIVRVIVTRGDALPGRSESARILVIHHPVPFTPSTVRLAPMRAPWHPAGREWELAGVKTTSYAPNAAATRRAVASGLDDALLLADDDTVLEGPTFCVGWVRAGAVRTPSLGLGILDSITRRHVLSVAGNLEIPVEEGRYPFDDMASADEVFAMSTVKEVTAVVSLGDRHLSAGPVTERLRAGLRARIVSTLRN